MRADEQFGRNEEAAEIMEDFLAPMIQETERESVDRSRFYVDGIRAGRAEALFEFFLESAPEGTATYGHQRMIAAVRHAMAGELDVAVDMVEEAFRERALSPSTRRSNSAERET